MIFRNILLEIIEYRSFLKEQILLLVLLRYRRTALGYFWTLLNPIFMILITTVVFSSIYDTSVKEFATYTFSGMLAFNFIRDSLSLSSEAFLENEDLILKVYIPRIMFPLSRVIFVAIDNILLFFVLSFLILGVGGQLSSALIFLPISYLILISFCMGISIIFSVSSVYFRDLPHFLTISLQVLLFTSPVFLRPTIMPSKLNLIFQINPISYFIDLFRYPIYEGTFPPLSLILVCIAISIVSLFFGFNFFIRNQKNIALNL